MKRGAKVHLMKGSEGRNIQDGNVWAFVPQSGLRVHAYCGVSGFGIKACADPKRVTCRRCM